MRKTLTDSLSFFILFFALPLTGSAQQLHLNFNHDYARNFEKHLYNLDSEMHTAFKPYRASDVYPYVFPDTTWDFQRLKPSAKFFPRLANVAFYEHLLEFSEEGYVRKSIEDPVRPGVTIRSNYTDTAYVHRKFHITADPYIRLELGYDNGPGSTVSFNKRGVILTANIGDKLSLFTSFSENQAKFADYLEPQIRATRVIPGEGKARNFGASSFDFANVWGYLNYRPNKYFSIEAGNGKHFIGDGYRSLFLSDNSYVYPYFKAVVDVWRFRYQLMYAELQNDIGEKTDFALGVTRKFANFNYLSVLVAPGVQVGLFEGLLWQRTGPGGNNEFDYNFLNPVPGVRGLQKNLDVQSVYGLNFKVTMPHHLVLYGQWMINQFSGSGLSSIDSRMGVQAGLKYFDVGGVPNLHFQTEYNRVRPYAYTSGDSAMHYTHYDQPLAHPLGANFNEVHTKLSYRYGRFYTSLAVNWSNGGIDQLLVDSSGMVDFRFLTGSEILITNNNAPRAEGLKVAGSPNQYSLIHTDFRAGVIVNPKINLKVEFGITSRRTKLNLYAPDPSNELRLFGLKDASTIFVFSVSTQLFNNYYDNIQRLTAVQFNP